MVLHSPLTVTERWRHGYGVFPDVQRKLPFGSGATLAYNYIDLQITNTTEQDFQLNIFLSETKLLGELLCSQELEHSYEVYEDFHLMQQEF
jgi:vancomycin resistance protein VanW